MQHMTLLLASIPTARVSLTLWLLARLFTQEQGSVPGRSPQEPPRQLGRQGKTGKKTERDTSAKTPANKLKVKLWELACAHAAGNAREEGLTWYLQVEGHKGHQVDDRHAPQEHAPWQDSFSHGCTELLAAGTAAAFYRRLAASCSGGGTDGKRAEGFSRTEGEDT